MKFNIVSIFPQMFSALTDFGIVGQAVKSGRIQFQLINPRDFTEDFHKTVDDRPYGGGDGMVMLATPLQKALEKLKAEGELGYVVYLSPQGSLWSDQKARGFLEKNLALEKNLTLICGRYGGVDERLLRTYVDEEISVGDYVLSGGEIPAMALVDSLVRFIPGVLGNKESPNKETFSEGLLEAPQFTRPQKVLGSQVPEVLTMGDHAKIESWRRDISLVKTAIKRPQLMTESHKRDLPKAIQRVMTFPENDLLVSGLSVEKLTELSKDL